MYNIKVTYKDNLTLFELDDRGLAARLEITLNEKGHHGVGIYSTPGVIVLSYLGMISMDELNSLIKEQFNPNSINLTIGS